MPTISFHNISAVFCSNEFIEPCDREDDSCPIGFCRELNLRFAGSPDVFIRFFDDESFFKFCREVDDYFHDVVTELSVARGGA